jgi:hypothetical protein
VGGGSEDFGLSAEMGETRLCIQCPDPTQEKRESNRGTRAVIAATENIED